jgi:enhancer of yellow 2 transcription factor
VKRQSLRSTSDRSSLSAAGRTSSRNTVSVSSTISFKDLIRNKGLEKINLDDLVEDLLPKGRALVPTKVKEDLLARIKHYLESDPDYKRLTGF